MVEASCLHCQAGTAGLTRGAAVGHAAWARRVATHPKVLAAGQVSESAGRLICLWTAKLPEKFRAGSRQKH